MPDNAFSELRHKRLKYLALTVCAIIVVTLTAKFYLYANKADDYFVIAVALSPNKKNKAVLYNQNGGGAISPYCFDFVSVAPVSVADKEAWSEQYNVYTGSCHSLGFVYSKNKPPALLDAPLINWASDSVLEITYDPTKAASGINGHTFRTSAESGKIRIVSRSFEQAKNPYTKVSHP